MSPALADLAPLPFTHLAALTGDHGLFEHAAYRVPRLEHGYCTDDVARALTVVVHEPDRTPELDVMAAHYLSFVERAVSGDGGVHNRMSAAGVWTDLPTTDDWWGRAVAGLGSVVRCTDDAELRVRALGAFLRAAGAISVDVRACAFAAVGAADVLHALPGCDSARALLVACLARVPRVASSGWGWPEPRLRYANASLCSALIAGGHALGDEHLVRAGLSALDALLVVETGPAGHLSVTGTRGRAPGQGGPLWDQQPIEPGTIADACAHALAVTGDRRWAVSILGAWGWFVGDNDSGTAMIDPVSGAGYDGLTPSGRNENCGAESTLAALRTHQHARAAAASLA